MSLLDPKNYVETWREEGVGGLSSFGIRIEIQSKTIRPGIAPGFLNKEATEAVRKAVEIIKDAVLTQEYGSNPDEQARAAEEKRRILALFPEPIYVKEIPNGYCSRYCCKHRPWFEVTTKRGVITIGWRKSVMEIQWQGSDITATGQELFPNENVTVGSFYIHAWDYEAAKRYIDTLLAS